MVLSPTVDCAWLWPTRYWRYFSKPSLFFRKHMATSSSVSQSFNLDRNVLETEQGNRFLSCCLVLTKVTAGRSWVHLLWKLLMSSMFLKMVSFWLLTSDGASGLSACFMWWEMKKFISLTKSDSPLISSWISWLENKSQYCNVSVVQVASNCCLCKFSIIQVVLSKAVTGKNNKSNRPLHQGNQNNHCTNWKLPWIYVVVTDNYFLFLTYNSFLLYSPSETSSALVSGRSPASAESWNN